MNKVAIGWQTFLLVRKSKKFWSRSLDDPKRYPLQGRNDYLVHKVSKVLKTAKIKLEVKGYDNLNNGPALLYGNHQDNIDALVIMAALKKQTEDLGEQNKIPTFIAKHTLQYKKTTRYPLYALNTFFLDRANLKKSLETYNNFGKFVKENKTFGVIFPEGTRNREGSVGEFKPGAFKVAKKELLSIIPFTINNSVQGMNLDRNEELKIEVIFHKRIPANSFVNQNTIALAERVENIVKSAFVKPSLPFIDVEEKDVENTKEAIKFHKKEAKKEAKKAKKERKERDQLRKIEEAQEKENAKYEKYIAKKEAKESKKHSK